MPSQGMLDSRIKYVEHFHHERNHQGKGNVLLFPAVNQDAERQGPMQCRERLGGLLKYYTYDAPEFFDSLRSGMMPAGGIVPTLQWGVLPCPRVRSPSRRTARSRS